MIRFNQFTLARGTKPLFEQTSFTLNPGEKAGLVGANGAGKSTLFAVLRGELHADGGDFAMPPSWQIAHVAQETPAADKTALAWTLDGDRVIYTIEVPAQSRGTLELDPGYGDVVIDGQPFSGAGQGPRDLLSAGPHEVTFRMAR